MGRPPRHEEDINSILNVIRDALEPLARQVYEQEDVEEAIEKITMQKEKIHVSRTELMEESGVIGSTFYSRNPYHHLMNEFNSVTYEKNTGRVTVNVPQYLREDYTPEEDEN